MSFLDELLGSTKRRVEATKANVSQEVLEQKIAAAEAPRGFGAALRRGPAVAIIAEIKRATPSRGPLRPNANAAQIAQLYAAGGAAAISVLTEPERFDGSLEDLAAARSAGLPVLRKDFVIDPFQVLEARAWEVDAVLLIVRCVGDRLTELLRTIEALRMDALVEVHTEDEVDAALEAGASLVGVNHRDLSTFDVDPDRTAKLAKLVPDDVTLVALSGVASRDDVLRLQDAGAHAVLVGEALMTAADPAATLRDLLGAADAGS